MINCKGLDLIHRSMSDFAIHPTGRALSTPPRQTRRQEMNGALRSPEAVTESSNSTFIHLNLVRGDLATRGPNRPPSPAPAPPRGRFSPLMASEAILVRDHRELSNRRAASILRLVFVVVGVVSPTTRPLSNFPAGPQTSSTSRGRAFSWFARQPHVYRDEDERHRACGGIPFGAVVWTDFLTCPNSSPCRRVCWHRSRASSLAASRRLPRSDARPPSPASP